MPRHERLMDKLTGDFKIVVENDNGIYTGWFEHEELGDEYGGELWFEKTGEGIELYDYDGTTSLPKDVIKGLRENGYIVSEEFE